MNEQMDAVRDALIILQAAGVAETEVVNGVGTTFVSYGDPMGSGLEISFGVRADSGAQRMVIMNSELDLVLAAVEFVNHEARILRFDTTTLWPFYVSMIASHYKKK